MSKGKNIITHISKLLEMLKQVFVLARRFLKLAL